MIHRFRLLLLLQYYCSCNYHFFKTVFSLFSLILFPLFRDLKTPNIFLTRKFCDGIKDKVVEKEIMAKIGDFGLSEMMLGTTHLKGSVADGINPRFAIGTIFLYNNTNNTNNRYAAPEIIEGNYFSLKSDVYSMGLLLWELRYRKIAFYDVCFLFFFCFILQTSPFFHSLTFYKHKNRSKVILLKTRFEIESYKKNFPIFHTMMNWITSLRFLFPSSPPSPSPFLTFS